MLIPVCTAYSIITGNCALAPESNPITVSVAYNELLPENNVGTDVAFPLTLVSYNCLRSCSTISYYRNFRITFDPLSFPSEVPLNAIKYSSI